ncbi:hypothetical protein [Aeromicrobium sp.]|uniref:hypothetical protein n=1 Tax=Aeromicrobium sp. TaxID=1871063 RepID=UPI003C40AB55
MTIMRKPALLVVVVLMAAVSLSACGDKDRETSASPGPTPRISKASADLTQASFMSVVTQAQRKAGTSHVVMALGIGGQRLKADGDLKIGSGAEDTAMSLKIDMGSAVEGFEMRLVNRIFYLDAGPMTQGKFVKIDLTDESSPLGQQFGPMLGQLDPATQLEQLNEAMTSFGKTGNTERIDGVDAQPYEIVVDTAKIALFADLPGRAAASIPERLTFTMFVGPDDLPRRIVADVMGSIVTVNFSRWGDDVDIRVPSSGELSDRDPSTFMGGVLAG